MILLATAATACGDDPTQGRTGTLRILGGIVEVETDGAIGPASHGQEVRPGDTIHTGFDGRAEIRYFDGSLTRLDFNTAFTIVALEVDNGATVIEGRQVSGNTYHRVVAFTESGSRFDVETPSAIAAVQGTEYALFVDEQNITTVVVFDQSVAVRATGGDATVEAGFSLSVGPPEASSEPVGDPEPTPQDVLDNEWIVFNQEG